MQKSNKNSIKTWGVMLPGCMFLGMGLGYVFGNVPTGMFIGMGVGFILSGILTAKKESN